MDGPLTFYSTLLIPGMIKIQTLFASRVQSLRGFFASALSLISIQRVAQTPVSGYGFAPLTPLTLFDPNTPYMRQPV